MSWLVASLGLIVALQYLVIAIDVVPRLVGMAQGRAPMLRAAKWGACAFFAGCAATHLAIVVHALTEPSPPSGLHLGFEHVLPHVAQVVGGITFIVVAQRRMEIRLTAKDVALRLREVEERFRASFERAPLAIALISLRESSRGQIIQVNEALCAILGRSAEELQGRPYTDFTGPGGVQDMDQLDIVTGERDQLDLEQPLVHRDGHEVWVHVRTSLVLDDDGQPLFNMVQLRDIGEERRARAQLRYLADHDPLTGLYNRRRFEEELQHAMAVSHRYDEPASLLLVDLDGFKFVNDTYGHLTGDELLRTVGTVLRSRLREADVVGRLGGDEFGVICPHTDESSAIRAAEELVRAVREDATIVTGSHAVHVTASIGVRSVDAGEALGASDLLQEADLAMYTAKERGRDRASGLAPGAKSASIGEHSTWSERVRHALDHHGFTLYEQPILDLVTGTCERSEMLLRMLGPDGRITSPGVFLPVAERFGQIQAIDSWVLRTSVDVLAARQAAGSAAVLEVNLSAVSMSDESLVDDLVAYVGGAAVDPTKLVLEVTETAAVAGFERVRACAERFHDLGCRFALDDFGSGFASFGYLKHLPFDTVKIDGGFVLDLASSRDDQLTVQAMVQLCDGMGKETMAEFVQDEATVDLLRSFGVRHAQGHHIARPGPVPELAPQS